MLICSINLFSQVNGELSNLNGKRILKVWGNHYERGYAQGYLLSETIVSVFNSYVINNLMNGSPATYSYVRGIFINSFETDPEYIEEASGLIDGIADSGTSLFVATLNRDFDFRDVLIVNSIIDLIFYVNGRNDDYELLFGCSSLSSWGESTMSDEDLEGGLVITRLLDWQANSVLIENPVMLVSFPSETDEQYWVGFGYPGFICALSGINQAGVTASLNIGSDHSKDPSQTFNPIMLTVRKGLESYDYNNDSYNDHFDVVSAVVDYNQVLGTIIHATKNTDIDPPSVVIENNNQNGEYIRDYTDNTVIPGMNLAATNHFRNLYSPEYCYRYNNIVDSLNASTAITASRSWKILAGAAGVTTNLMTIQFNSVTGRILWSTTTSQNQSYNEVPTEFYLNDLLTPPTETDEEAVQASEIRVHAYPNPFNPVINFAANMNNSESLTIEIYNIKGRKIDSFKTINNGNQKHQVTWNADNCASGVYLFKALNQHNKIIDSGKIVLLK